MPKTKRKPKKKWLYTAALLLIPMWISAQGTPRDSAIERRLKVVSDSVKRDRSSPGFVKRAVARLDSIRIAILGIAVPTPIVFVLTLGQNHDTLFSAGVAAYDTITFDPALVSSLGIVQSDTNVRYGVSDTTAARYIYSAGKLKVVLPTKSGTLVTVTTRFVSSGQTYTASRQFLAMQTIIANAKPTAAYSISCIPGSCLLNGGSSTDDNAVTSWTWRTGGGRPEVTGATVTRALGSGFVNPFTQWLVVADAAGLRDSISHTVTIPAGVPSGPITLPTAPTTFTVAYPVVLRTLTVGIGDNLQTALDTAIRGDKIVVQSGATYVGNFVLKKKAGTCTGTTGWVIVTSSALASLPALGTRVAKSDSTHMPRIRTDNNQFALSPESVSGVSCYWLDGLNIDIDPAFCSPATLNYHLLGLGDDDPGLTRTLPDYMVLERSWVHGQTTCNTKQGVQAVARHVVVRDSYIDEIHQIGDAQAIESWAGGPYQIINNTLIGGAENLMFGGADAKDTSLIPRDAEIRRNYFFKPLTWKGVWVTKNLIEFKNMTRALVEGNYFENSFIGSQQGACIVANNNGYSPEIVTDLTIRLNYCVGMSRAFEMNFTGERHLIEQNLMENVNVAPWDGSGYPIIGSFPPNITFRHNTFGGGSDGSDMSVNLVSTLNHPNNFELTNNLFQSGNGTSTCGGGFRAEPYNGEAFADVVTGFSLITPNAVVQGSCLSGTYPFPAGTVGYTSFTAAESAGYGANRTAVTAAVAGVKIP